MSNARALFGLYYTAKATARQRTLTSYSELMNSRIAKHHHHTATPSQENHDDNRKRHRHIIAKSRREMMKTNQLTVVKKPCSHMIATYTLWQLTSHDSGTPARATDCHDSPLLRRFSSLIPASPSSPRAHFAKCVVTLMRYCPCT